MKRILYILTVLVHEKRKVSKPKYHNKRPANDSIKILAWWSESHTHTNKGQAVSVYWLKMYTSQNLYTESNEASEAQKVVPYLPKHLRKIIVCFGVIQNFFSTPQVIFKVFWIRKCKKQRKVLPFHWPWNVPYHLFL